VACLGVSWYLTSSLALLSSALRPSSRHDRPLFVIPSQMEQAKLEESQEFPPITVLEPAVPPDRPSKPKVKLNLLLGTVVGLFGGG